MKTFRNILSWIVPILVALVIVLLVRTYLFEVVGVLGDSMEPNLANKERMMVIKPLTLKRNSVIVFDAYGEDPTAKPNTNYVKRVIGMPGDTVASKNGHLFINGKQVSQSYISASERAAGTGNWTLKSLAQQRNWSYKGSTVPQGKYFVLGDHRSVSEDSRYWGYVDAKKVMGVVKIPFWQSTATYRNNINSMAK
ncbi:signal peptidase I [Levilactobacillus spicheri]|uniref:Signal peptidase I n=2 Tax=Levilactobacillus spicheri TaxID=216463 RepID=A0A0F3RR33_9LACO|nr:signal peptidase I [Levilactobacillus spicheri]KJW12451.1 signal peptidase [Levilactobacillus spicheri]KRL48756.1 Signal peptidase I [Levilactobacillus spicheri DSM 15429]GEO66383.1 signal peptidase I [Levilactobacillus spicheri]